MFVCAKLSDFGVTGRWVAIRSKQRHGLNLNVKNNQQHVFRRKLPSFPWYPQNMSGRELEAETASGVEMDCRALVILCMWVLAKQVSGLQYINTPIELKSYHMHVLII